jgi:hypothetical protein
MIESILMYGPEIWMEGTRRSRENARKIFERSARNGQMNAM